MEAVSAKDVRRNLAQANHNCDNYLQSELEDVDLNDNEMEEALTIIFSGLAEEIELAADDVENQIATLEVTAKEAHASMVAEIDKHLGRLVDVKGAVNAIKVEFDSASEGAVKIGDRLTTSVEEKNRLLYGIELIDNINWLKSISPSKYDVLLTSDLDAIKRDALPEGLAARDWGYISLMLSDMRRVLHEISEEDAQNALKNVFRLSEHVEMELLNVLLKDIVNLMDDPNDKSLVEKCKQGVKWLHLYNNGQTLVKRYVYTVIQNRMPENKFNYDAVYRGRGDTPITGDKGRSRSTSLLRPARNFNATQNKIKEETLHENTMEMDYLSQLFATIQSVCVEQFKIIKEIFPEPVIPRITRVLIQRIYNDPAFGIQGRVDAVLQPKPPSPPLPLADYLEYLSVVKEKLGALYLMLLELFLENSVSGIAKDNWNMLHATISREISGTSVSPAVTTTSPDNIPHQNSAEIEEFLQEQIMQVLSSYLGSYFDKEMQHLKKSFGDILRRALNKNLNMVSGVSKSAVSMVSFAQGSQAPRLRADKFGSLEQLTQTIANDQFLDALERLFTDSVLRMTNVGKDEHRLGSKVKDAYLLLLNFITEGVVVPLLRSCANLLTRGSRTRASSKGRDRIPSLEVLDILSISSLAVDKLRAILEGNISKALLGNANMLVVCREALKGSLKPLHATEKDVLYTWNACIIRHMEYLLGSLQRKSDYGLSFLSKANKNILGNVKTKNNHERVNPANSTACDQVCQVFLKLISAMRGAEGNLGALNTQEHFWKPIGRHFVGILITHLRKQSITETGASQLMHDLDEYYRTFLLFQSPEIEDMLRCLVEMCAIFTVPSSEVKKIIVEDLRHLDTVIVLALSKARSDYNSLQKGPDHWTRLVAAAYGMRSHHWEFNLPWEQASRRVSRAGDGGTEGSGKAQNGPVTLRKSAQPVSNLYMELLRGSQIPSSNNYSEQEGDDDDEGGDRDTATGMAAVRVAFSSVTKGYSKPSFMPASPISIAQGDNQETEKIVASLRDDPAPIEQGSTLSSFLSSALSISPLRDTFGYDTNEVRGDALAEAATEDQPNPEPKKTLRNQLRSAFLGKSEVSATNKKGKGSKLSLF